MACEEETNNVRPAKMDVLRAALTKALGPDTPDLDLRDRRKFMKLTTSVNVIELNTKKACEEAFDFEHSMRAAAAVFTRKDLTKTIILGQRYQGKSQFLYFLFKLLQSVNETVVYFDESMVPHLGTFFCTATAKACITSWSEHLLTKHNSNAMKKAVDELMVPAQGGHNHLGNFLNQLVLLGQEGKRVWLLVDDSPSFLPFMSLPKEQTIDSLRWILTGSSGMGSYVSENNLRDWIFNLPLFTIEETQQLMRRLEDTFPLPVGGPPLEHWFGVPQSALLDTLQKYFSGVPGYLTECVVTLHLNNPIAEAIDRFQLRVHDLIRKAFKGRDASKEAFNWMKELEFDTRWDLLMDAGLSGWTSPPAVVLHEVATRLFQLHTVSNDALRLAEALTRKIPSSEIGLHGWLLELTQILQLRHGDPFSMVQMTPKASSRDWETGNAKDLFPKGSRICTLVYSEESGIITLITQPDADYFVITLPFAFPVLDVVICSATNSKEVFAIQITQSTDPFRDHFTLDTCDQMSQDRVRKLLCRVRALGAPVAAPTTLAVEPLASLASFVMVAPMSAENKRSAPNAKVPYFFSPAFRGSVVARSKQKVAQEPRSKEPKRRAVHCCACKPSSRCDRCKCKKENRACNSCAAENCQKPKIIRAFKKNQKNH